MTVELRTPRVGELRDVVEALREWQSDVGPMQLHPGDVGWTWALGDLATAAAVRMWTRDGRVLAVGLTEDPSLLRMTIAPDVRQDEELAQRLLADLTAPARGVLGAGRVCVDAVAGARIRDLLADVGWVADEAWTPLRLDLAAPVPEPALRIEVVGPETVSVRTDIQRASFDRSTFTDQRWQAMAAGLPYADARCLLGYDDRGVAVAAVTVWSAGAGRPGLLEPMGVSREHRGRGYGRAITLAAATALRGLGSSCAVVATPSANIGGVATYRSAGFRALPEIRDLCRTG